MTGRLPRLHGHRVQLCPARTTYTKMIGRAVAGAVWRYGLRRVYYRRRRGHASPASGFSFYTVPYGAGNCVKNASYRIPAIVS